MYSQHDEEAVILANTPPSGRCLDIGAYSFEAFSNTRALIQRGWEAVLIEPSAGPFQGLINAYKDNKKVTLVNAFAGSVYRPRRIYMSPDALTTGDPANYEKWKEKGQFTPVIVTEIPLDQILCMVQGPFDFINIDTEGSSVDLLKMIPLCALSCRLVCVEYDNRRQETEEYLRQCGGFTVIYDNGTNLIAKRAA